MVKQAWKLAIEADECQWALAGGAVGTPSVSQLPCDTSHKIDPHIREAVGLGVGSTFLSDFGY
jgi:hypothetical protein